MLRRLAYAFVALMGCLPAYSSLPDSLQQIPLESVLLDSAQLCQDATTPKNSTPSMDSTASLDSVPLTISTDSIDEMDSTQFLLPAENGDEALVLAVDSLLQSALPQAEKFFTPDPLRSFWLSLILPGAGQIYNHKYWKLPVVYGGFLGCVYALSWNGQMLRDYSQAYLDIMDDDPETKSYMKMLPLGYNIEGREEHFKDVFRRKKDYYRKYRDMSIFAFAGVYLISVIDAYVDAELSAFDIRRDLTLRWAPTHTNNDNLLAQRFGIRSYGVQCSLTF